MSSETGQTLEIPAKPSNRLPSLNQLAARININATSGTPANNTTTSAPRPRLAAFALRTNSNASIATNDSMAVNAPSTRSTSPSALSTSPPQSEAGDVAGGESLTSEKLDKLNQEIPAPEKKATKVGYKNIPSLDAITARLAKARALSIDGSAKPPDAEMIEDPKTPGFPMKAPEHPLQYPWCV